MLKLHKLKKLSDIVYSSSNNGYGQPCAIKVYKEKLYIGCSLGPIRVFDVNTCVEENVLIPKKKKNFSSRVTCIDVSLTGDRLAVGYTSGKICIFDLIKLKVLVEIDEVCKTEVNFIKFLSDTSSQCLITADKRGFIHRIIINKGLLKYNSKSCKIMENPVPDLCSIAVLKPKEGMPYEVLEISNLNITAISSTNRLSIYYLNDPIADFYSVNREDFSKNFIREGSLCHLDWGYGITPTISRVNSKCLLAIGWDKVLQIAILGHPQETYNMITFDGYYICDYPIDRVQFISDSVIMILVNKKEVRLLFIPSFLPGSFSKEGLMMKEAEDSKMTIVGTTSSTFQVSLGEDFLRDLSLKAEVETGVNLLNGNIRYTETAEKQNFSHSIVAHGNNIMVLGQHELMLAILYHWEDYLEYIKKQCGWLVCLKAALDIFSGEIKGYYGVPYISEDREEALIEKLKDLVLIGITSMIKSFYGSRRQSENNEVADVERDDNAIKVAIEFCHEINSFEFLFTRIFAEFQDEGFEDKFVENLEPFILSGYFKEVLVPNPVLKKICDYYFENRKYLVLEKIASCLDFTQYEYLDELTLVCSLKSLTTTMIHLTITSNQAEENSCSKILQKVYQCFKSITKQIDLEDIKEWYKKSKDEKYEIAGSYQYIGLKLMHIILLFLRGEKFPEGRLNKKQYNIYLMQTIEFLFQNEKTFDLLEVDARSFFIVISEIYMNKSVCNLVKELNDGPHQFTINHEIILEKFKEIVNGYASVKHLKFEYSYWIIKIANCEMYKSDPQKIISKVFESIIFVLHEIQDYNEKKEARDFEIKPEDKFSGPNHIKLPEIEQEILDLLPHYTKYMEPEELNEIIEISTKLLIDRLRIFIYEDQKDFEQCIQTYLTSDGCKTSDVFDWLHTLYKKKRDILEEESIIRIQSEIMKVIQDFIITDSIKTSQVIDEWLPSQQIEIIDKLSTNEELQLKYLSDFISEREEEIRDVMLSAGKMPTPLLHDYKYFLKLHIKLLAKLDPRRIEIKDYYPIDCLDDVKDDNVLIREARAFLYKRCGDIDNSLTIFLGLLEEISYDEIRNDGFQDKMDDSKFTLSFSKIFSEISNLLVRWTSIPGYKDKIWYQVLRALFRIKKKYFVDVETKKTKAVNLILFNKISDYLELMSKYIEFGNVIKLLLEVDERATFRYSKKWFQSLFVSKADQEFLYKSAQKLLSNENSAMVDNMVDMYQHGYKGGQSQNCDHCKTPLVNVNFERALIFCMCKHNFHRKCYNEEIKLAKSLEIKSDDDKKFQCPICRKHNVSIEEKQRKDKKKFNRSRSNRRKKKGNRESINSSSEDSRSSAITNDESSLLRESISTYKISEEERNKTNYMIKMKAFDEDFSLSSPSIIFK